MALYDGDGQELARLGDPAEAAGPVATFPVTYRGEELARVCVHPRRGEQVLTAADHAVIQRVCAYAGPALDGARALAETIASRSQIVLAREEERKRMRAILHDDLAPSFSGLSLTASALTRYVGDGNPRTAEVAARLAEEFSVAMRQLRDLAYDLRPPVLDDRGLVPALHDRLVGGDRPTVVIEADAASRSSLPAAVESAAFRIVSEAVTNVRRHAAASTCTIELSCDKHALRFRVTDDGIGLASGATHGVGLTSMRERATELGGALRVGGAGQHGTLVEGWLPLGAAGEGES